MKRLSWLFCLTVAGLVLVGAVQISQNDFLTGTELIGWASISLALLLGFIWPTRCRVETSQHAACKNDAYGFLFGCKGYGHWKEKFLIRIGLRRGETRPVQPRQPAAAQAFMHQPIPQSPPVRVIVEDTARSKYAFWIALASAVAGIVQAVIAVMFR